MKKLTLIAICVLGTFVANAQIGKPVSTPLVSQYGLNVDTVTNTGTRTKVTPIRITGTAQTLTIGTSNTLLTGTLAGVARLYGSLDGIHYTRIRTGQLYGSQVDSLVIETNQTNYHWIIASNPFNYYEVQTTGSGTVTFTSTAYLMKH